MNMVLSKSNVTPVREVGKYPETLNELSRLINLLEADLPSSISNPKNEGLEASMRATMKRYFRNLTAALPLDEIEAIYYRYVEQE